MKRNMICIMTLLVIVLSNLYAATFTKQFPLSIYNPQFPESAWGSVYSKNIAIRQVGSKLLAVNVYKRTTLSSSADSGPFDQVSQTYAYDLNNDNMADLITVTYPGKLLIKHNKGFDKNGSLLFSDVYTSNLPVRGEGAGIVDDFDKDGKLDLFLFNQDRYGCYVSNVYRNNIPKSEMKSALLQKSNDINFKTMWTVTAMAAYDYNGDGYKDIIYADMSGRVWFWPYDKQNNFIHTNVTLLLSDSDIGTTDSQGGAVLDMADINNDGIPDLVAGNTNKRGLFIYFGKMENNQLKFSTTSKLAITKVDGSLGPNTVVDTSLFSNSKDPKDLDSFSPTILKITDIDRDGLKDVIVGTDAWRQGKDFGGSIYLFKGTGYTNDGKPKFVSIELIHGNKSGKTPPYDFDSGTVADLDNDGTPDFVAADGNNSGNYYKVLTKTSLEYETDPGYMISDYFPLVTGVTLSQLPDNFVRKIRVTVAFDKSKGDGFFEIRYMEKGISNPALVNYLFYPLMPGVGVKQPLPDGDFTTEISFSKALPDPQIIIVFYPKSATSAPYLEKLIYSVETEPSRVNMKNFYWSVGG